MISGTQSVVTRLGIAAQVVLAGGVCFFRGLCRSGRWAVGVVRGLDGRWSSGRRARQTVGATRVRRLRGWAACVVSGLRGCGSRWQKRLAAGAAGGRGLLGCGYTGRERRQWRKVTVV